MGTIPTPPTFVAGEIPTASKLNQLRDAINFWALTPRTYAWQSVAQSLPNGTVTAVTFTSEVYDVVQSGDTASHDNTTDPSRIYVRTSGKYEISAQVQIASNATGARTATVRLNAAGNGAAGTVLATNQQSPVTGISTSVSTPTIEASLTAGDYIELFATQTSGGALNTVAGLGTTFMRMKLTGT